MPKYLVWQDGDSEAYFMEGVSEEAVCEEAAADWCVNEGEMIRATPAYDHSTEWIVPAPEEEEEEDEEEESAPFEKVQKVKAAATKKWS